MPVEPPTYTRRAFLQIFGAVALSAAAAPLLARFVDDDTPVEFTTAEIRSLNEALREVYGGAPIRDLVYASNPFLELIGKGGPYAG